MLHDVTLHKWSLIITNEFSKRKTSIPESLWVLKAHRICKGWFHPRREAGMKLVALISFMPLFLFLFFISLEHLLFPKEQNVLSALKQLRETEVSDPITEFSFVCFLKSNYYDLDHDFAPLRGSGGKAPGESGGCRLLRYVTTR